MYAKVIVDVPAKQTNRPFDYLIPEALEGWIEVGSRVAVSFGARTLQGFVVEIFDHSTHDAAKIKAIEHVLDLYPPLTTELVELAHWMSDNYLCHEITALQVMIPGALKAKYERQISWNDAMDELDSLFSLPSQKEVVAYIQAKGNVSLEALLIRFPDEVRWIKELVLSGQLVELQTVKDRMAKKKVMTLFPPADLLQLKSWIEQLPEKAKRQKQVLQFMLEYPHPIKLTELMLKLDVSASTVKGLAEKGWLDLKEIEVYRDPYAMHSFPQTYPLPLTEEQRCVFTSISQAVYDQIHRVFLLHGVTGSGKTEVYLQSIQQCLDQGKEAIVLVPEISLTPQMVERFKGRFGEAVAVLHSRLSQGERYDEWRKISLQKVKVVIGARSAVFAPFTKLGLIIIDEEHESSYKQEDSPKYHAREVAIERAKRQNASVVLGSATPSLESYYRATNSTKDGCAVEYTLLTMAERVEGRPLPPVQVVDMREELKEGNRSMFSRGLYKAIEERLHKKEQTVLLLNRRGYSTFVMCRTCGYTVGCPHCDISLTYHQSTKRIRCHYCGYTEREVHECPSCGSEHIRYFGTGTQRVEEELVKLFPGIRVIRMDVDTTNEKGSHEKWLNMFRDRQADVLLGTQMVAKGLDFPDVTLVGVIAADTVLNLPDFRAGERTFQLLTQVAGRAGRHQLPGEVFIQTYTPEHYSIQSASHHDYEAFIHTELDLRQLRGYPPYNRLILVTLSHEQIPLLVRTAESYVSRLKELAKDAGMRLQSNANTPDEWDMDILGPVASPIPRIKDRYRFQCMLKYRGERQISQLVNKATASFDDLCRQQNLQISVDVDPQLLQ
ncbi:MAG: primosomal protein [Bacilli bacterium]|nr:primosomal protein [Bacilli bacterium]